MRRRYRIILEDGQMDLLGWHLRALDVGPPTHASKLAYGIGSGMEASADPGQRPLPAVLWSLCPGADGAEEPALAQLPQPCIVEAPCGLRFL